MADKHFICSPPPVSDLPQPLYQNGARLRCEAIIPTGPEDGTLCNGLADLTCVHCGLPFCTSCAEEFSCFDSPNGKHEAESPVEAHAVVPTPKPYDLGTLMCTVIDQITRRAA
jgi:hypothetical protein